MDCFYIIWDSCPCGTGPHLNCKHDKWWTFNIIWDFYVCPLYNLSWDVVLWTVHTDYTFMSIHSCFTGDVLSFHLERYLILNLTKICFPHLWPSTTLFSNICSKVWWWAKMYPAFLWHWDWQGCRWEWDEYHWGLFFFCMAKRPLWQ